MKIKGYRHLASSLAFSSALCLFVGSVETNTLLSQLSAQNHQSKYKGEENRHIKSLSAEDIEELERGGGWGFAKVAELNGFPGPVHILEMGSKLDLSSSQRTRVQELFQNMNAKAKVLGKEWIRLEANLNDQFAKETLTEADLVRRVKKIGEVRAELRGVHLAAHLETPKILTKKQRALYNELRGYGQDPCQNIPEGHNTKMWKKHNDCDS